MIQRSLFNARQKEKERARERETFNEIYGVD